MMSGTLVAQILLISVTPILTRLYTVEDFGNLSVFMSLVSMLAVGSTGKFELAIVLPKKTITSSQLVQGILYINHLLVFLIVLVFLLFFGNIVSLLELEQLSYFIWLVPLSIVIIAFNTIINHWFLRFRKYHVSSIVVLGSALVISLVNLVLGYTQVISNGLVCAYVIAQFFTLGLNIYFLRKNNLLESIMVRSKLGDVLDTLKKYINFPKYQLPSEFLFTTAAQITPIIFAFLFTKVVVGHFALALRLVKLPLVILANAINSVFRNEALDSYRNFGNCELLFLSLLKKLIIVAIIPFTILFFIAPDLFEFVLGDSWREAGTYAQLLVFGLFFELLSLPFRSIFQITNTQFIYLRLQTLSVILIISAIFSGYYFYDDSWYAVLFFSIASAISHLLSLSCIYFLSKGEYSKINLQNS